MIQAPDWSWVRTKEDVRKLIQMGIAEGDTDVIVRAQNGRHVT